ncbi:MAG: glycosyltransferase, partial [Deltaproteobacteria bacterium]
MPERYLFIRPDTYGDIVLFEPVLRLLRQYKPECKIYLLIRKAYLDIAPMIPDTVHWLTFGANPYADSPVECFEELMQLKDRLNEIKPDIVVAPLYNKTWMEVVVASWYPKARKISLGDVALDCYTTDMLKQCFQIDTVSVFAERVEVSARMNECEKNSELASALCYAPLSYPKPQLKLLNEAENQVEIILSGLGLLNNSWVACCPAGVANVPIKKWPAEKYGEVIAWLKSEKNLEVCLLGHSNEKNILDAVQEESSKFGYRPLMWLGNDGDIPLLCSLLDKCEFYFGNDTGAMHMAGALGRPVVAVYGGGTWPRFLPASDISVVITQELPCFYCMWKHCVFENALCIRLIDPETVKRIVTKMLNNEISENYIHMGSPDIYHKAEIFMKDHNFEKKDALLCNILLHGLPKITIVTPSYNQGQYLEECMDSVLSQNYPNLEYIVMDGGSNDNSVEIIKKYEKYLTYWQSKPDGGQYKAIDDGFNRSTGSIMAWLNSDDKYHKNAFFIAAHVFLTHDDIEWIMGRPTNWDENGNINDIYYPGIPLWSRDMYLNRIYRDPTIQQESVFWRRSLWEKAGGYIEQKWELAGDLELWRRFFRYSSLITVDALMGGFRNHPEQKTKKYLDRYFKEAEAIIDEEIALFGHEKFVDDRHSKRQLKIYGQEIEKFISSVHEAGYKADLHYDTYCDSRLVAARDSLIESELDRHLRFEQIQELTDRLKESESDRSNRLEAMNSIQKRLDEVDQERNNQVAGLTERLRESENDRQLRFEQ